MPKQMSGKTFSNLLEYYITCLEQEDMLSVTFEFSSEGTRFVSTPLVNETLFYQNEQQVIIEPSEQIKRFFQASLLQQKNKSLFYGYPVVVSPGGMVSPLFFTEVHYERKDERIIVSAESVKPTMNQYLFTQEGFS